MIVTKAFSVYKDEYRGLSYGIFKCSGGITCPPHR